jgi:hypothetical protein
MDVSRFLDLQALQGLESIANLETIYAGNIYFNPPMDVFGHATPSSYYPRSIYKYGTVNRRKAIKPPLRFIKFNLLHAQRSDSTHLNVVI